MTVNSNSKEIFGEITFGESCIFDVADGEKIICAAARSSVNSYEALNGEFRVSVKTIFSAVFFGEDYEVKERTVESVKTVTGDGITPASIGVFCATTSDCAVSKSGKASANVTLSGYYIKENVISYLNNEIEGIHCRTMQSTVENVVTFLSSLSLTHSDEARMPVKKILDCHPIVTVNNIYPAEGSFRVEGELNVRIVALTDNKEFLTQTFTHPFGTEVGMEACSPDKNIDVEGTVTKCELTLTDGDARIIISDTEIAFLSTFTEKKEINGVIDCYSTDVEITAEYSSANIASAFCIRSVKGKAVGVVACDSEITELYCAIYPNANASAVIRDGGVYIEGLLNANILYSDENNLPASINAEIPFSIEMDKESLCSDALLPTVVVSGTSVRLKTGRDVEISADLYATLRGSVKTDLRLISAVTRGDKKPEDDYAISLYIVKPNEDLWDVAKALNTDEDTLLKLNPDLKLPLAGGEKVLIYKELLFNM